MPRSPGPPAASGSSGSYDNDRLNYNCCSNHSYMPVAAPLESTALRYRPQSFRRRRTQKPRRESCLSWRGWRVPADLGREVGRYVGGRILAVGVLGAVGEGGGGEVVLLG